MLLSQNCDLTELHELLSKCGCSRAGRCSCLPFTGDNSKGSIDLPTSKEKGLYLFFLFSFFLLILIYMCVEVKRYLFRGGVCLRRGQGDGEMPCCNQHGFVTTIPLECLKASSV